MIIVGCDYHPSFQQIAFVDTETGELKEQRLGHREGAEEFYRALAATGQRVSVGMEASGHARWFERLLAELRIELKVGDASDEKNPSVTREALERMSESLNNIKANWQTPYKDYCAEAIGTATKIGEVDLAKKLLKQGVEEFEKLEAVDTDSDDPNVALKAWWPSTAVLLRLLSSAVSISEQTADEVVHQISDQELRVLCQLRLANLRLHVPMGESIVQMMSSKLTWGEYQMETDKN